MSEEPKVKTDYAGNSNKAKDAQASKPERESTEKVITGKVIQRKETLGRKIATTFTGDDAQGVFHHLVLDVALPAAQNLVVDMVSTGIERLIFGDAARRPGSSSALRGTKYVPYDKVAKTVSNAVSERRVLNDRARRDHDFDQIILEDRTEAEKVLIKLRELVDSYETAAVADLYDAVGITPAFTDNKYGWTNLTDAGITRVRGGYLLDLPPAKELE